MSETTVLGWNVNQGGYDRRHIFDDGPVSAAPEREPETSRVITQQRNTGVDSVALIDTYGWRQRYGADQAIADHIGFRMAGFVDLGDDRIDRVLGPGAGLVFATNHTVDQLGPLDLGNRQGIKTILSLGSRALQIATLYLDDTSEAVRLAQMRAALSGLEKGEPTLIIGDLNTLRPNLKGASIGMRAQDVGFRAIATCFGLVPKRAGASPKFKYYRQAISELNNRRVVPYLERHGFLDADCQKRPTFRALGGLGVDYAFHNSQVVADQFTVVPTTGASDHDAIRMKVSVG